MAANRSLAISSSFCYFTRTKKERLLKVKRWKATWACDWRRRMRMRLFLQSDVFYVLQWTDLNCYHQILNFRNLGWEIEKNEVKGVKFQIEGKAVPDPHGFTGPKLETPPGFSNAQLQNESWSSLQIVFQIACYLEAGRWGNQISEELASRDFYPTLLFTPRSEYF